MCIYKDKINFYFIVVTNRNIFKLIFIPVNLMARKPNYIGLSGGVTYRIGYGGSVLVRVGPGDRVLYEYRKTGSDTGLQDADGINGLKLFLKLSGHNQYTLPDLEVIGQILLGANLIRRQIPQQEVERLEILTQKAVLAVSRETHLK